ncbi:hypothetical protein KRP22_015123 [Phytophthora ramorum]|nr:Pre-mRNA-splicing factor 38 [Phytophthora ramorum]
MNATDPGALSVHGVNPQTLVEKIMRNRIYASIYWKSSALGSRPRRSWTRPWSSRISAARLPEIEVVKQFVENEDYKYVTVLGAVYLRLVGKPADVYTLLEPLLSDYRKIRKRNVIGWEITHVDEIADALLTEEYYIDLTLPRL